ncbi:MAG TPA: hypothetical protein DEU95_08180, partial [Chloroflexi bacterium]|nr:hypothetical protein [Chloroflexota bacterium]
MDERTPGLDEIRADVLAGRIDRRTMLKRAMALGLSAPIIAGLLAACGGSEKATSTPKAEATTAATQPAAASSPTAAATAPPATSPTTGGTTASPTAPAAVPSVPGHGRGKADLLRILYWQAPTILNPHFSQGTKDSAASSLILEPLIDVDIKG